MNKNDPVVIISSARTPIGGLLGVFKSLHAPELASISLKAAIKRGQLVPDMIEEVILGCVLSAGIGQAPARQAAMQAGIPNTARCTTINKMCGSGMKAVMLAHDLLMAGSNKILIAGGMESMTQAPYLLNKARAGYRLGHAQIQDHILLDGLEDAYEAGTLMGVFAERTAEKYGFSRKAQDEFALLSLERAKTATKNGWFLTDQEIVPTEVKLSKQDIIWVKEDEQPNNAKPEKIPHLKPAFKEGGTVTAANSSSISDGAAALVLMRLSEAKKQGLKPIASILGHASYAQDPAWFTTAPVGAIQILLDQLKWSQNTPDLYEINEAFAVVTMAAMQDLKLAHDKVNIHGGACALGHPIGASGARIMTTLLGALKKQDKTLGIAALCIGGGEATAIAIERM